MFFSLTPEMIARYNKYKNQTIPTFNEYFNSRYYDEVTDFYKTFNFSLSFKNMLIVSNLQNIVRNKIMQEYIHKYPTAKVEEDYTLHEKNIPSKSQQNTDNTDDSYDIVENQPTDDSNENITETQTPTKALRRSTRLRNKTLN